MMAWQGMKKPLMVFMGAAIGMPLSAEPSPAERIEALGDRVVDAALSADPTISYYVDLPARDHRNWPDHSPSALHRIQAANDAFLAELRAMGRDGKLTGPAEVGFALIFDKLESERRLRVCRVELWMGVSHIEGWHLGIAEVAEKLPVETPDQRTDALIRWNAFPAFVDQEIMNLRTGIAQGYSAPKAIVRRVLGQLGGLTERAAEASPLYSPAKRSDNAEFTSAYRTTLSDRVLPALRRYRAFLEREYLPRAREALAIAAHPNGRACYDASLRLHTTLDRTAEQTHAIGRAEVGRNVRRIAEIGLKAFGTADFATIIGKVATAPDNRFANEDALVGFSREVVSRARERSRALFLALPDQPMRVEPFPEYLRGSGASSFYEMEPDPAKPATYRIGSENWQLETRGSAEVTAVHEAYPGHHMQIAFARELSLPRIAKLSFNGAFVEGWARYAEALGETAGIYTTDYASISRRAWAARGMVADPGLHVMGWSRERTASYLASSGRISTQEANELVDRMAIMPGQLTAYDSGGLEIMALRREAEAALGRKFDIRAFHQIVLEQGAIPLALLRLRISRWIKGQREH